LQSEDAGSLIPPVVAEPRIYDATESVEVAVKSHPLCERIAEFVTRNERAMDTLRGIAKCWVNSDEIAVKSALETPLAARVLVSQSVGSGTYYSQNPDARLKRWLKAYQASHSDSAAAT
jgi:hypothetical protein